MRELGILGLKILAFGHSWVHFALEALWGFSGMGFREGGGFSYSKIAVLGLKKGGGNSGKIREKLRKNS